MAYVAPTWKDGGPPALNAAALQAISDAIVGAESKNASQDSLIATLQTAVGGKGQIEVGSYVGTGTYGASNLNSITFSFAPKMVIFTTQWLGGATGWMSDLEVGSFRTAYAVPMEALTTEFSNGKPPYGHSREARDYAYSKKSSDGKTLTWYNTSLATAQLNSQNYTYFWIAFG